MEKIIFLKKKSSFHPQEGLGILDFYSFHGLIDRVAKVGDNNLGGDPILQLKLHRNIFEIPEVFQPSRNLVVSANTKKTLETLPNIEFFPVEFVRLFNEDFGSKEKHRIPKEFHAMEEWFRSLGDSTIASNQIPSYYEVIMPSYKKLEQSVSGLKEYTMRNISWDKQYSIKLSSALFSNYPMIWTTNGISMRCELFEILDPKIDRRYFNLTEVYVG